ncbi:MAG: uracil-xanthine permease, partial [Clostridia bacterium]|nr:uracil-xanthine permease [Clostridia bacterium]
MKLIYGIDAKPKFGQLIVFAIQQLLAIMAATLVVPINVSAAVADLGLENPNMSPAAALVGAGAGTLVYVLFTLRKSPVFLGSSFAFIPSMIAAFTGATTSVALGYLGLVIGAAMAGLVYVVLAIIVKFAGTKWIDKLMPAVVIGPTVSIIGLGLAGSAVGQLQSANAGGDYRIAILVGLVTLAVTMLFSVYGKKFGKLIP